MNILDENIPETQCVLLRSWRFSIRQIGQDIGRNSMQDDEIIPLLHRVGRATFFTLDADFFDPDLRHEGYCLVYLDVQEEAVAEYIRKVIRHRELNTKAKRMGRVIRAMPSGLAIWSIHQEPEGHLEWK